MDLERDCKQSGCVISSLTNYTEQAYDRALPAWRRAQAAKFVVHFVGDLHQPLHNEDVAKGGNGIHVLWGGRELNLHQVWDSSILEKWLGGLHGKPYPLAKRWAAQLSEEIRTGKWAGERDSWVKDINLADTNGTALAWSREANAIICSHGKSGNIRNTPGQHANKSSSPSGTKGDSGPGARWPVLRGRRAHP